MRSLKLLLVAGFISVIGAAPAYAWKCCKPLNTQFGAAGGGGDAPGVYALKKNCENKGYVVEEGLFCPWNCFSNYSTAGKQATQHYYIKKSLAGNLNFESAKSDCKQESEKKCTTYGAEALRLAYPNNSLPMNLCGTKIQIDANTRLWRGGDEKNNPKDGKCDIIAGAVVPAVYSCPQGGSVSGTNCVVSVGAEAKCPKDYWLENHKKPFQCVKQACAQGSMPGVPAWLAIGGAVNGGKYLTDDKGGSRFFINATFSCASGFTLSGENCVKTYPATLVTPAKCNY
jgi:hypothetical protein